MRFFYIVVMILALTSLISWLNYSLLSRLFSFYRGRMVRYSYLFVTATAILITCYSWVQRPSSMEPNQEIYYLLVYGALAWLCGQFALIIFLPFLYAGDKVIYRTGRTAPSAENRSPGAVMTRRAFLHNTTAVIPLVSVGIGPQGIYHALDADWDYSWYLSGRWRGSHSRFSK